MRSKGQIVSWKWDRGFGFIRDDDGTQDIFVHIKEFENRSKTPTVGDRISYKITFDGRARLQAVSVRFQGEGFFYRFRPLESRTLIIGVLAVYAVVIAALSYTAAGLYAALAVFLLSIVSYLAYRTDKRAAERRQWRIPEKSLHFLSLLGGWPGALIAQTQLRHKSSKSSFKVIFYLTILLNLTAIGYVFLSQESKFWESLESGIHQIFRFSAIMTTEERLSEISQLAGKSM